MKYFLLLIKSIKMDWMQKEKERETQRFLFLMHDMEMKLPQGDIRVNPKLDT